MTRLSKTAFRPTLEALGARELPSVSSVFFSGTTWVARTDSAATAVTVSDDGTRVRLTEGGTGRTWSEPRSRVSRVELQGGSGNDRFTSNLSSLPVLMFGGAGHDTLLGGGGSDELQGGNGLDYLNGRGGNDRLFGQNDADTLVAIDGGNGDTVDGGAAIDVIWVDGGDASQNATSGEQLQRVNGFSNGADRTLNGDNVADPARKAGTVYRRFSGNPLFGADGPRATDATQGDLANCWLIAGVGAVAQDSPQAVRNRVVDFADGTYGVRLGDRFYRVDDELPAASGTSTRPAYAKLGAGNAMWVAVLEKAYAHHRTGANSYASTEWGHSDDVNRAFGSTAAGRKGLATYSSAAALANDIYARWVGNQAVCLGFDGVKGGQSPNAPLVMGHAYTVVNVTRNAAGTVTGVRLRNPWGTDGAGNDGNNDGFVTVTPAQLFAHHGNVYWGRV
jgi:hypothetical protein